MRCGLNHRNRFAMVRAFHSQRALIPLEPLRMAGHVGAMTLIQNWTAKAKRNLWFLALLQSTSVIYRFYSPIPHCSIFRGAGNRLPLHWTAR